MEDGNTVLVLVVAGIVMMFAGAILYRWARPYRGPKADANDALGWFILLGPIGWLLASVFSRRAKKAEEDADPSSRYSHCPSCNALNHASAKTCFKCGKAFWQGGSD